MIQNTLNYEADQASARYALLTDGWQGEFGRALNEIDFGSSTNTARMIAQATQMGQTFLEQEVVMSGEVLQQIAREAHQTTLREIASNDEEEITDRVGEHLEASQTYLVEEAFAQVRRDLSTLRKMAMNVSLETSLASKSRGISDRQALIEYRLGNKAVLDFSFIDRGNRKWSSRKFVRTLWRQTMLSVYNETVMMTLADHGIKNAIVEHIDPNAESHGTLITFGSNSELPTYSEIRDVIFHPNSNAILKMESSGVSS